MMAHPRSRGEHLTCLLVSSPSPGSSPLTRGALQAQDRHQGRRGLIPAHAGSTRPSPGRHQRCTAHPRSRGEHCAFEALPKSLKGSSPLTRGALCRCMATSQQPGLIPAHAGSTRAISTSRTRRRAHPRSRGEHNHTVNHLRGGWGSSPLTRGARVAVFNAYSVRGLIPAHAGSTPAVSTSPGPPTAHPRSRGEHGKAHTLSAVLDGSSPLTRGAGNDLEFEDEYEGLIPAHAGSTVPPCCARPQAWAHPRSRGEHVLKDVLVVLLLGSSPLTRGARASACTTRNPRGLIPAHAGSTGHPRPARNPGRAHPRSRGEHPWLIASQLTATGSSPLTRGARQTCQSRMVRTGLIPAHEGSTGKKNGNSKTSTAHPRSRGEHACHASESIGARGSSPLTRGALSEFVTVGQHFGLIPAHAGSTTRSMRSTRICPAHPRSRGEHDTIE